MKPIGIWFGQKNIKRICKEIKIMSHTPRLLTLSEQKTNKEREQREILEFKKNLPILLEALYLRAKSLNLDYKIIYENDCKLIYISNKPFCKVNTKNAWVFNCHTGTKRDLDGIFVNLNYVEKDIENSKITWTKIKCFFGFHEYIMTRQNGDMWGWNSIDCKHCGQSHPESGP